MSLASIITYAHAMIGTPYKFGGNNPIEGIDCSGLVTELMKAAGELEHGQDLTAQQLFDHFAQAAGSDSMDRPAPGALAFYGKSVSEITHVAFMITPYQIIEAGGGDRTTLNDEVAAKKNAFVRMRLLRYRKDFLTTIKPGYRRIGML